MYLSETILATGLSSARAIATATCYAAVTVAKKKKYMSTIFYAVSPCHAGATAKTKIQKNIKGP